MKNSNNIYYNTIDKWREFPAAPFMIMDMLEDILRYADNPSQLAIYLTKEIRHLIGARIIILIQYKQKKKIMSRVVSVYPERYKEITEKSEMKKLAKLLYNVNTREILSKDEFHENAIYEEACDILLNMGYEKSIVIPLKVGEFRVGELLMIDILDMHRADEIVGLIDSLSTVIALVMRNAVLYESQEEMIEELAYANDRLLELDKLKSMFIASMSHEFRTPLNSIIGFTDVILEGMDGDINDIQQNHLSIIKTCSTELLELVNDVIDVSKIEADKIELVIIEFDLVTLIQEIHSSFEVIVKEKKLDFILDLPEKLMISSDEFRVKQIIKNFVSNAIKFTEKGTVEIKASQKGTDIEVIVKDTGRGIKQEDMDKLFKQFSRIYSKGLTDVEGVGLGLYLSQKLAHLLGGKIIVESTFGQGSAFKFVFPTVYSNK